MHDFPESIYAVIRVDGRHKNNIIIYETFYEMTGVNLLDKSDDINILRWLGKHILSQIHACIEHYLARNIS